MTMTCLDPASLLLVFLGLPELCPSQNSCGSRETGRQVGREAGRQVGREAGRQGGRHSLHLSCVTAPIVAVQSGLP